MRNHHCHRLWYTQMKSLRIDSCIQGSNLVPWDNFKWNIIRNKVTFIRIKIKTYKHSAKGSKSWSWHVTKTSIGSRSGNLIFFFAIFITRADHLIKKPYLTFPWSILTLIFGVPDCNCCNWEDFIDIMSLFERLSIIEWSEPGHCDAVVSGTPFSVKTNPWLLKWSEKDI